MTPVKKVYKEHHGFIFGLIAAFSSAATAVFVKLGADIPVSTIIFSRFVLGLPLFLTLARQQNVEIAWRLIPKHLLRAITGLTALALFFYSVRRLPLVNAMTLSNTLPLFMPIVVLIQLRLVVSKMRFLAGAIGFIGVIILLRPTKEILEWGNIAGLCTGLFGAIAMNGVRQLSKTESTEAILAYFFLISSSITFLPMLFFWEPISWMGGIYLVAIGIGSIIYQYTITKAYTHAPATKVSTMSYLGIVFSGLAGWWLFGEVPNLGVWIGTLIIVGAAILSFFDKQGARPLKVQK